MNQYFLRFADREEALTLGLSVSEVDNQDGEVIKQTDRYFIDSIGIITELVATGETDDEGLPTYNSVELPGYHINILADELPQEVLAYEIQVNTPYRTFSGY